MSATATIFNVKGVKALRVTSPVAITNLNGRDAAALAQLHDGIAVTIERGAPAVEVVFDLNNGEQATLRFEGDINESKVRIQTRRILRLAHDLLFHCQRAHNAAANRKARTLPTATGTGGPEQMRAI